MSSYTDQVLNALTAFDTTLAGFGALVRTRPSSATVLRKDLDKLTEWANRAGAAASQLRFSSNIIVDTAVDIVDFQVRLQGEAAALASALGGLASFSRSSRPSATRSRTRSSRSTRPPRASPRRCSPARSRGSATSTWRCGTSTACCGASTRRASATPSATAT